MADRMEQQEFVPVGERLNIGRSIRAKHCNANETMIVTREAEGIRAHCFRCAMNGWHPIEESLHDKLARIEAERHAEHEAVQHAMLPEPREYNPAAWPIPLKLWLYKAGFSASMIEKLGAYYCADLDRVVLPVFEDGKLIFWQARSQTRKPKVISPRLHRRGLVAKYGQGETVVLCEDILSAFKVGLHTEAWSLLGTSLSDDALKEILYRDCKVIVWLDGDGPGQKAAAKILKTLRAYGVSVANVVTEKDPKLYSRDEIEEKLIESGYYVAQTDEAPEQVR